MSIATVQQELPSLNQMMGATYTNTEWFDRGELPPGELVCIAYTVEEIVWGLPDG